MTLLIVTLSIAALILLISAARVNAFLCFLVISIAAGLMLGIPAEKVVQSVEKGLGDTLGSLVIIVFAGAMLGKLIAESGAASQIAGTMMRIFGIKYIKWAMVLTGFVIGIPLYYGVGFVLMVPLVLSIAYRYKLPTVAIGIPLLAALSVTHGYLPPHPSPSALVLQFNADMGLTLIYGIIVAIPAIILAGPVFSSTLKGIKSQPLDTFVSKDADVIDAPGVATSFFTALLPVLLLAASSLYPYLFDTTSSVGKIVALIGQPSAVMLIALAFATFTLGINRGRNMRQVMATYTDAVKDIVMVVLIMGGSGALKQVLTDSGASVEIAAMLKNVDLPPLVLGWLIAAVLRACVGSATVAGLTAAGIIAPLLVQTHVNPNLMVLSIGAGSLMFSHVNDSGFWLYKEYFNLNIKDTLKSWSVMEAIVSTAGLAGVLLLNAVLP
ncbi:gluconate transporter [Mucilaginibacter limnophilus]|uniref:Gluconate transporter n=1 Tax=Mucilaginibacter limnophilus TaxID=1932778 RepID=A0A3S2UJI1_9SPHI|nr:gluconate:H+ symporter [Mucilaginibacter limnophilus]RVT98377.1 gluconate transporter [Mucilaginibacter limnophilus]